MIKLINDTVSKLNDDEEHNQYILMDLMVKIKIDPNDPEAYNHLYLVMCEEIGMMIDDIPPSQQSFDEYESQYIKSCETIQDTITEFYMENEEPELHNHFYGI